MSKEIYISSTPHETRLAIVEDDNLAEVYYERENEYTLAGSIYNGRVTRVLPGMQSSFVDVGLERDAFLYITDFMEEAGDSADFEAAHGGSGESRSVESRSIKDEQRSDASRGEGQRRDRSTELTLEGNISAASADRGRSRNRRGDRDRSTGSEYAITAEQNDEVEASVSDDNTSSETTPVLSGIAEAGQGAPGADGSRRWRGRRGRRRGRGGNQTLTTTLGDVGDLSVSDEIETGGTLDGIDESIQVFGKASLGGAEEANSTTVADPGSRDTRDTGDGMSSEAPRSENQNWNRDRTSRGREERSTRGGNDRGPRVPRGFAPSHDLYGVDSQASEEDGRPAEPVILPGESLSKYRQTIEGEAVSHSTSDASSRTSTDAPSTTALAKPATLVDDKFVASSWDGGLVLPGETLSRRSNADASRGQAARQSTRDEAAILRQATDTPVRSFSSFEEAVDDQPTGSLDAPSDEQLKVEQSTDPDSRQDTHSAGYYEPPSPFSVAAPAPLDITTATPDPGALETEYEPEEASASYRIDPVAISEFRQSASVLEEPLHIETASENSDPRDAEPVVHVDHSHPFNRLDEANTEISELPKSGDATRQGIDEDETLSWQAQSRDAAPDFDTTGVPPPPPPGYSPQAVDYNQVPDTFSEVTSIASTGEMHSKSSVSPGLNLQPESLDAITSISHETAVVDVLPEDHLPHSFAPGDGQLEEELIDEEEHEPVLIHAHHVEEFDELEEETLEGAADLGTMIREMSIDQITRPELDHAELDEEDFEEEEAQSSGMPEDTAEFGEDRSPQNSELHELGADSTVQNGNGADFETQAAVTQHPNFPERRTDVERRPRRDNRRDGRRDGRDRNRSRNTGGEAERGRQGYGGGRSRSMQVTNLPAIGDLLKPGQEILVQIAKEPIAKKGARITSHIALPGRFLVFMPTVSHIGVSRKIESDGERRRLKEILLSEKGEASGGFIVRTAALGASEDELRSDLRFLLNLWADIKQRSESSKSPALIYHDLNLVERVLRDQVTDTFSAIWVDTESEYERVLRFLQRFQPSLIRRVKLYTKETPLFEQFGISEEINKALRSKVWLKSGGSIVINQTEALVAIDINTGKFVGKTARLEDTIVKTNLDAIPEIVRQIRLRDLGGIIIIDFIDMDERKNRSKVMAALEEELKNDRAPSKVLQFNDFGLVAITRKRVKQSLERTLSTTCGICQGTGMTKSPITVCNDIYVEMRKMQKHLERNDVMLRVNPEVVKQLKSGGSKWLQEMEEMVGKTILVKSDPSLHPEQFDIH